MKQIIITIYNDDDFQNALHEVVSTLDYENIEYEYKIEEK